MQRLQYITKNLVQQNKNHFSLFRKFIRFLRDDDKPTRDDHVDKALDNIKHNEHYQFPVHKELSNERKIALTHQEDMQQFIENQREITDLEKLRMKKLDEALGTNTHFHEIGNYEERLDSEHVMRRKIVALDEVKKERIFQLENILNLDPQEKIKKPNLVLKPDYFKNFQNIVSCPRHEKDPEQVEFYGRTYLDNYSYLKNKDNSENDRINQFVSKENMFSKMKLLKNKVIFDTLLEECSERVSVFHQQQIIYKDYIYYSKDPNMGHAYHNLYRCASKKFENLQFDQSQINPQEEKLIFSQEELLKNLLLDEELKYDIDIQNFIESLQDDKISQLYDEINFSYDHNWVSFSFDVTGNQIRYLVLIKNIETGKIIIIKDIAPTTGFIHFDQVSHFVHAELSDLSIYRKLIITNLESFKQTVIKEFNPDETVQLQNFELDEQNIVLFHISTLNSFENEVYQIVNGKCQLLFQKQLDCQILIDYNDQFLFKAERKKNQGIKEIYYQSIFLNNHEKKTQGQTQIVRAQTSKIQNSGTIYSCEENEEILELCALKNYLVMIIKDLETHKSFIKRMKLEIQKRYLDINMMKRKTKTLELEEFQYSIEKESNQNRNSNNFLFINQCPYKPYQVLSYNLDVGIIDIFFQEYFSGFDQKRLKSEQFSISLENQQQDFTFFYYQDKVYDQSTLVVFLKDEQKISQKNYIQKNAQVYAPNTSLYLREDLFCLLWIRIVNFKNIKLIEISETNQHQFLSTFIKKIAQANLSKKVALYCDGSISCFNGLNFLMNSQGAVDIIISHNGTYNSLGLSNKQLLQYIPKNQEKALIKYDELKQKLLAESPYQIEEYQSESSQKKIAPRLKNALFTCRSSYQNASSTRQLVAMLRENKNNNSDILYSFFKQQLFSRDDYRVNFIEYSDEQTNQEILLEHFSYLISSAYLFQK